MFNRYLYNYFDNFHIRGTLPVHGHTENKVNELMNILRFFLLLRCSKPYAVIHGLDLLMMGI